MIKSFLLDNLRKINIPEDILEESSIKLEKYINEIILFNSAYNLTNTSNHDELVTRHIIDSLSPYTFISEILKNLKNSNQDTPIIADIGSGGGLPGIPLSIVFNDYNFNLVERMNKRCAFLENCTAILGLKNVQVINSQAEDIACNAYDLVVFRAFRPLEKDIINTLLRITKTNGYLLAYKAKLENITAEMQAIKNIVPKYTVQKLFVPNLEENERNLVIIKKE